MTVDIRLNQMINAFDAQLDNVLLEDVELSIRSFAALTRCGCVTLGDAKKALKDGSFLKQKGVGQRAAKEVEEIIRNVGAVMPTPSETEIALFAARREIEAQSERILHLERALARIACMNPETETHTTAHTMSDIALQALKGNDEFIDPNHYWYRQGKDDGIEQERGNIVEWLRYTWSKHIGDMECEATAHAIEAGEHLK